MSIFVSENLYIALHSAQPQLSPEPLTRPGGVPTFTLFVLAVDMTRGLDLSSIST
ncbi:hypothetical protein M413DRAFT_446805 [Hebeloma cylindrosporum]|uniref:Uncharacterized protein n=1 Tax=Hebeloma cylindrosporum TaxID=76867 RepID=A0A0C3C6N2_HEBCY|nr:hypothetical protein M413DRAFT_446805 [Hebeloma cylindrosporum h7]